MEGGMDDSQMYSLLTLLFLCHTNQYMNRLVSFDTYGVAAPVRQEPAAAAASSE